MTPQERVSEIKKIIDTHLADNAADPVRTLAEVTDHAIRGVAANTSLWKWMQIHGSSFDVLKKTAIHAALAASAGSTSKAAKLLGISVRQIQYRMRDWYGKSAAAQFPVQVQKAG